MLEWHRREEKQSMWWEYFRLCDLSDAELIEDKELRSEVSIMSAKQHEIKRSALHRYNFPPQDHAIDRRSRPVHDPKTKKGAGELIGELMKVARTIDLKRGASVRQFPAPRCIGFPTISSAPK